ncbi:hypothetical protein [Bradyrhizobium sp.]|jgi:hypothetical protein|uniref:hypothetical protein n=1 Tax=Bradyrhizobium sp. TaxID=376 RepID=UPI002DDDAB75|nr:hypothetical protein [Bradyrhizobium sp.]HEV2160255.1 hypothetical protein [Bradyrhizobium sp.]
MIPDLDPSKLMNYRAARSLKTRNTRIAFIGDSTGAGTETGGTTAQVLHSIPMQMAAKLRARGINAGANNRFGCASGTFSTLLTMDSRVTSTGAWTQGATLVQGGNAFACAAAGSMTFAPQDNITKFDLFYRDGAAGRNITYNVDAGGTTALNSSGTTQITKTNINAGTSGAHSLTQTWALGSITSIGVDAYDDTNGRRELSIWNWSIAGATSLQMIDNSDTVTGRLAEISSGKSLMTPDLAIIRMGINDWRTSVSVASMVAS